MNFEFVEFMTGGGEYLQKCQQNIRVYNPLEHQVRGMCFNHNINNGSISNVPASSWQARSRH
uniref:Uncharacterized protein n=1 Tax=Rhizophora mucronata TaxID=61149 RepID=A0A2P2NL98_RHIMU